MMCRVFMLVIMVILVILNMYVGCSLGYVEKISKLVLLVIGAMKVIR
jgi:hypothetical protein